MSVLAVRVGAGVLALLALIALRGKRWAYFGFVVLGLLYYPAQTHFRVHAPKCELLLPTLHLIVPLLHNYAYIALFAGFYWISWVQFGRSDARGVWALVAALLLAIWSRLRRKPAYVRLVRPHAAAAPHPAAPTSRVVVPPRGVIPPPPSRPPVPQPPDFSPGPSPVTPAADMAPTHEVAPREG